MYFYFVFFVIFFGFVIVIGGDGDKLLFFELFVVFGDGFDEVMGEFVDMFYCLLVLFGVCFEIVFGVVDFFEVDDGGVWVFVQQMLGGL